MPLGKAAILLIAITTFVIFILYFPTYEDVPAPATPTPTTATPTAILHGKDFCDKCHDLFHLDEWRAGKMKDAFEKYPDHKDMCRECHITSRFCEKCHPYPKILDEE